MSVSRIIYASCLFGSLILCIPAAYSQGIPTFCDQRPAYPAKSEVELRKRYEQFADSLDTLKITREYPKAIQNLLSSNPQRQTTALATLTATGEVETIPWMAPLLDSTDSRLRIAAGSSIASLVSATILRERRDPKPNNVVLKPLTPKDTDFRPLAWIVYRILNQKGNGNTEGYAATMIGYIGLKEFEPELRELLTSPHPAVTNSVKYALELLETQPLPDTTPLIAAPVLEDSATQAIR